MNEDSFKKNLIGLKFSETKRIGLKNNVEKNWSVTNLINSGVSIASFE